MAVPFCIPPPVYMWCSFSAFGVVTGFVLTLRGFSVCFSTGQWCWTPLHGLICSLCVPFSEMSVHVFHPCSNWIVCFLTMEFWESLYILDTNALLDKWLANISSHSVTCLFICLRGSLKQPNLKFFGEFQLLVFSFVDHAFGETSKISLPNPTL